MGLLDGELADAIFEGFSGELLEATLRKKVLGESAATDDAGDPVDPPTPTDYDCEGFRDDYSDAYRERAGIPEKDVKVCIFGSSLPEGVVPEKDDKVFIEDRWWQLRRRKVDPARALWECQAYEVPDGL